MSGSDLPRKFKFKRDQFRQARGGTSGWLNIYCSKCLTWLLLYQKDGTGQLMRLYLDRIFAPETIVDSLKSANSTNDFTGLHCSHCSASIAVPMLYEKEHRLALRLVPGSIVKKRNEKGILPAPILTTTEGGDSQGE